MSVWFTTPAHRRYALTAVCLEQRARVIAALAERGVEARCVVVADDENLDIARSFGFDVVEQNNDWLGRKFNDASEYAGQHGAEWIVPIGSDSWIDPAYLLPLPSNQVSRTSRLYAACAADRMVELEVRTARGAGPYMIHRSRWLPTGFRPATDEIAKGVDRSTIEGLGGHMDWRPRNVHALQYIGFRGTPHITGYDVLRRRWGKRERMNPWEALARFYAADLVEKARLALAADAQAAAA